MPRDLTPGVIDGFAEHAFSFGACAGLAIALHDATGWPLVKVTDADAVYRRGSSERTLADADEDARADAAGNSIGMGAGGLHWLVAHPSGKLLDIGGLHDSGDVLDRYDGEGDEAADGRVAIGVTDRDDAVDEYVEAKGEPVTLTVCASFIEPVLARIA